MTGFEEVGVEGDRHTGNDELKIIMFGPETLLHLLRLSLPRPNSAKKVESIGQDGS